MLRHLAVVLSFAAVLSGTVHGHAALRLSSPLDDVSLGDTPAIVRLTFTERPEPSLSEIHVVDGNGARQDAGRAAPADDDPLSLTVPVRPLGTGVYTVTWRIVSGIDGHATSGAYVFGVRASPAGTLVRQQPEGFALLESCARWILACGLVLLVGAAAGSVIRFGGPRDLFLATGGVVAAAAGVILLGLAQQRGDASSTSTFLATSIGRALMGRTAAVVVAAAAVVVARAARHRSQHRLETLSMGVAGTAALVGMAIHVLAGHAAAGSRPLLSASLQWTHFAACGVWLGGLVSLLAGLDRAASVGSRAPVQRFSALATAAIVIVGVSGLLRSLDELWVWSDLTTTGYGRVLLAKVGLFAVIAAFGAFNHWRATPKAATDLAPLKRAGRAELTCAAGALGAAALLGTLAPPITAHPPPGLMVASSDYGTTVRVTLSAVSDQPGPNRFVARVVDFDSRQPVRGARVTLGFSSRDDPDLPASSLLLREEDDGSYSGSGANLTFDGRWRIDAGIQRERDSLEVPLDVSVRGRARDVQMVTLANGLIRYTVEIRDAGVLWFELERQRAGHTRLYVTCLNFILEERPLVHMVVTQATPHGPDRELTLQRVGLSRFAADVDLTRGATEFAAVARTPDGVRMRAVVRVDVAEWTPRVF